MLGEDCSRIAAGTPAYASPEVLSGLTPEPRDDVFSFACVAYELLTGQHPFDRRSSLQARDQGLVPARAWNLSAKQWLALLSGLSWEREQRPTDIQTLLCALTAEEVAAAVDPAPPQAPGAPARELPPELMPRQGSWGFFVFIACALVVTYLAGQRQSLHEVADAPPSAAPVVLADGALAPPGLAAAVTASTSSPSAHGTSVFDRAARPLPASAATAGVSAPDKTSRNVAPATPRVTSSTKPGASLSEISFESTSIVTTESSIAAVFLVKRSPPLSARVRVQWQAVGGSADAGIDFASDAGGTIEFAVGQAQRAIYVQLRNDLLKEGDETFTVRLHSAQQARVGEIASAQATIRDDD
jgi:hypothetical protein